MMFISWDASLVSSVNLFLVILSVATSEIADPSGSSGLQIRGNVNNFR
jgi:hypothetical protein